MSSGNYDPVLGEQTADLVGQRRAPLDQLSANAMQRLHVLLRGVLVRYEPHRGPPHRFTDRFGIVSVVLVALDLGLDQVRAH
jgi:hypothetical protein